MTLKNLQNSPLVKLVVKRENQYSMILANGWVVNPHPDYAWPATPTRFHSAKTIKSLVAFLGRAERKAEQRQESMQKLSQALGLKVADLIMVELARHVGSMSAIQVQNFPGAVLAYAKQNLVDDGEC